MLFDLLTWMETCRGRFSELARGRRKFRGNDYDAGYAATRHPKLLRGRLDELIIVATLQVFTLRLGATHRSQSLRLTWSLEPAQSPFRAGGGAK